MASGGSGIVNLSGGDPSLCHTEQPKTLGPRGALRASAASVLLLCVLLVNRLTGHFIPKHSFLGARRFSQVPSPSPTCLVGSVSMRREEGSGPGAQQPPHRPLSETAAVVSATDGTF